jgi:hypothetical protein
MPNAARASASGGPVKRLANPRSKSKVKKKARAGRGHEPKWEISNEYSFSRVEETYGRLD